MIPASRIRDRVGVSWNKLLLHHTQRRSIKYQVCGHTRIRWHMSQEGDHRSFKRRKGVVYGKMSKRGCHEEVLMTYDYFPLQRVDGTGFFVSRHPLFCSALLIPLLVILWGTDDQVVSSTQIDRDTKFLSTWFNEEEEEKRRKTSTRDTSHAKLMLNQGAFTKDFCRAIKAAPGRKYSPSDVSCWFRVQHTLQSSKNVTTRTIILKGVIKSEKVMLSDQSRWISSWLKSWNNFPKLTAGRASSSLRFLTFFMRTRCASSIFGDDQDLLWLQSRGSAGSVRLVESLGWYSRRNLKERKRSLTFLVPDRCCCKEWLTDSSEGWEERRTGSGLHHQPANQGLKKGEFIARTGD